MQVKSQKLETKNIPKLRFPDFSGGWEEKRLGEVTEITSSKRVYSSDYVENGIPFFRGKEISELKRSKIASDILYIKKSKFLEFKDKFGAPQKDDLLITSVGTLGNIYRVDLDYDFYFKDGNLIWLKSPKENSRFLEMTLDFNKKELLRNVIGSTQKALTIEGIKKVEISLPPLPEQQKIAEFLGATDEWIENLKAEMESLEVYKKGMMQEIFSQKIRFKNDNGKDFPKLEEIELYKVGKSYSGLVGKSGEDFGEGQPFVTYKQIFDNSEIDVNKFALVKIAEKEKQNRAQFGDIFFTTSSETPDEVGFSSVFLDSENRPYLNSFSFGFRPNSFGELDPHFAKFFFRSFIFRKEVVKLAQGSTRYNISKIEFMKIKANLPSALEQQKIAEFLTSLDKVIKSKQEQIIQAEKWKKGLMQVMFV